MPAKPLTDEQKRDAARLMSAFKLWQSARRERGEPWTQDDVAELFDFGQSALSQYINGGIPLNVGALARFCEVLEVPPNNISPSIVQEHQELTAKLAKTPAAKLPVQASSTKAASRKPPVQV